MGFRTDRLQDHGKMSLYIAAGGVTVLCIVGAVYYFSSRSCKSNVAVILPVLNKDEFQLFPLIQKTVLSHNSAVYRFKLPRETDILGLPIGQHISLGATINEKEVIRSYTPISSDDDKGYFDLLIKTYPTGNISKVVGELKIGDSIKVRGPKGNFNYTPGMVQSLVMVAGGTGITPMYQILTAIAKNPNDYTKVDLIFANVNPDDILMKKELEDIAATHDNINVYFVLNNPPEDWIGGVGFVSVEILKKFCPAVPSNDTKLLICGPPPMVSAIKKVAVELGYEKPKPVSKLEDHVFAF